MAYPEIDTSKVANLLNNGGVKKAIEAMAQNIRILDGDPGDWQDATRFPISNSGTAKFGTIRKVINQAAANLELLQSGDFTQVVPLDLRYVANTTKNGNIRSALMQMNEIFRNPPDNLIEDFYDMLGPAWEPGLGIVTPLGNGEFRYTSGQLTTTSLVSFYIDAPSMVGRTFEIGAEFSMRSQAGDYRLALAEYDGNSWRGATNGDVDAVTTIDDPTWVPVTVQRVVADATTDRMRFAVQLVNPTTETMSIDVRRPYMIEV